MTKTKKTKTKLKPTKISIQMSSPKPKNDLTASVSSTIDELISRRMKTKTVRDDRKIKGPNYILPLMNPRSPEETAEIAAIKKSTQIDWGGLAEKLAHLGQTQTQSVAQTKEEQTAETIKTLTSIVTGAVANARYQEAKIILGSLIELTSNN